MRHYIIPIMTMMLCLTACARNKNAVPNTSTPAQSTVDTTPYTGETTPSHPLIGKKYVDVSVGGTDGRQHKLSEYIGGKATKGKKKYVLVDFWASWCRPCMMEMPNVKSNWERYRSQGFEVVGISLDGNRQAWMQAINNNGYLWPQLSDLNGFDCSAAALYGIEYIPWNFLCNEEGIIVAVELRGEDLANKLKEIYE